MIKMVQYIVYISHGYTHSTLGVIDAFTTSDFSRVIKQLKSTGYIFPRCDRFQLTVDDNFGATAQVVARQDGSLIRDIYETLKFQFLETLIMEEKRSMLGRRKSVG